MSDCVSRVWNVRLPASADLDEKTLGQRQLATVHLADARTFGYNQLGHLYLEFFEV